MSSTTKADTKAKVTIGPKEIRRWVEERGGRPVVIKKTKRGESSLLWIDFGDESEESLEEILWSDFIRILDDNDLAFLYQEETADGRISRFFKFVHRDSIRNQERPRGPEGEDDEDDDDEDE